VKLAFQVFKGEENISIPITVEGRKRVKSVISERHLDNLETVANEGLLGDMS